MDVKDQGWSKYILNPMISRNKSHQGPGDDRTNSPRDRGRENLGGRTSRRGQSEVSFLVCGMRSSDTGIFLIPLIYAITQNERM